jgi:microcystin-dependent protein
MATTTNYSWSTPDDTALVKDGAAAIRSLGTAIDSTVFTNAGAAINKSIVDAAGDLIYGTADNTVARLALGTASQVLTVNSGATAPEWASLPAPAGIPAGTVFFHAANSAPSGSLKANGAAISRSTYATLFSAIGTTFGVGDGSTTFNVPDLRGYFPRGWADDGSIDSGRSFGTTQESTTLNAGITDEDADSGYTVQNLMSNTDGNDGTRSAKRNVNNGNYTATKRKIRPVNIALLACIKF